MRPKYVNFIVNNLMYEVLHKRSCQVMFCNFIIPVLYFIVV